MKRLMKEAFNLEVRVHHKKITGMDNMSYPMDSTSKMGLPRIAYLAWPWYSLT